MRGQEWRKWTNVERVDGRSIWWCGDREWEVEVRNEVRG